MKLSLVSVQDEDRIRIEGEGNFCPAVAKVEGIRNKGWGIHMPCSFEECRWNETVV
jgi:hypothetical protein